MGLGCYLPTCSILAQGKLRHSFVPVMLLTMQSLPLSSHFHASETRENCNAGIGGAVPHVVIAGSPSKRFFADVIRGKSGEHKLKKVEVQLDPDGGVVMSEVLAEKGIRKLENMLVGVVLGRSIPLAVIDHNVSRMWKNLGVLVVVSAGLGMVYKVCG